MKYLLIILAIALIGCAKKNEKEDCLKWRYCFACDYYASGTSHTADYCGPEDSIQYYEDYIFGLADSGFACTYSDSVCLEK